MITDKPTDTDTNEEQNTSSTTDQPNNDATDTQATQEAQEIVDSLNDKPEVLEALYEMLQEQFDPTPQPTSGSTPKMMDTEGMPQE
jgi:hypothetical protein